MPEVLRDHRDRHAGLQRDGREGVAQAVYGERRQRERLGRRRFGGVEVGQVPRDAELPGDSVGMERSAGGIDTARAWIKGVSR